MFDGLFHHTQLFTRGFGINEDCYREDDTTFQDAASGWATVHQVKSSGMSATWRDGGPRGAARYPQYDLSPAPFPAPCHHGRRPPATIALARADNMPDAVFKAHTTLQYNLHLLPLAVRLRAQAGKTNIMPLRKHQDWSASSCNNTSPQLCSTHASDKYGTVVTLFHWISVAGARQPRGSRSIADGSDFLLRGRRHATVRTPDDVQNQQRPSTCVLSRVKEGCLHGLVVASGVAMSVIYWQANTTNG